MADFSFGVVYTVYNIYDLDNLIINWPIFWKIVKALTWHVAPSSLFSRGNTKFAEESQGPGVGNFVQKRKNKNHSNSC